MNPETDNGAPTAAERRQSDRRRNERYDTALKISIRFLPDGSPVEGSAIEMGPNGMRLLTELPLSEATYVHISFDNASNNTQCEGRVVWTTKSKLEGYYESGVDIQRWGGDVPQEQIMKSSRARLKKDRRRPRS